MPASRLGMPSDRDSLCRASEALSRESASAKWQTDAVSAARMSERCWLSGVHGSAAVY